VVNCHSRSQAWSGTSGGGTVRHLHRAALAAFAALLPTLAVAASSISAPQSVTTEELQRYIYQANYPTWCGAAGLAAREMRVKPTTDPKTLHGVMKANIAQCANTTYAQQHAALWNTAVFGAAAAALLAARHEPPAQALRDATQAKSWSADIVKFTHQPGAANMGPGTNTPSMYRTNAGRIHTDAVALINAIKASTSGGSTPAGTAPAHAAPAASASPKP
jgi:hypothetical protein